MVLIVIVVVCLLVLSNCYVNDIVLLEPCLSFRIMEICDKYAHNHLNSAQLTF